VGLQPTIPKRAPPQRKLRENLALGTHNKGARSPSDGRRSLSKLKCDEFTSLLFVKSSQGLESIAPLSIISGRSQTPCLSR
jgi:hypothetical protein